MLFWEQPWFSHSSKVANLAITLVILETMVMIFFVTEVVMEIMVIVYTGRSYVVLAFPVLRFPRRLTNPACRWDPMRAEFEDTLHHH